MELTCLNFLYLDEGGCEHVLVVIDHFTGFTQASQQEIDRAKLQQNVSSTTSFKVWNTIKDYRIHQRI